MIINFSKKFDKRYAKLSKILQDKVDIILERFRKNPFDDKLRNHQLKGMMKGKRAISVTGDIRIIFEEYSNYTVVLMLDIGKHARVYNM